MMVASMALITSFYYLSGLLSVILLVLGYKWDFLLFFVPVPISVMLFLIVVSIPLFLNWSRNMYGTLLKRNLLFILFSIIVFSVVYFITGVSHNGGNEKSLLIALYFSINTFTTLGYGDMAPVEQYRLISSLQAIIGVTTIPILTSIIWLYCSERLHRPIVADEDLLNHTLTPDGVYGMMREISQKSLKDRARRKRKLKISPCALCNTDNQEIEKYFDWVGKTHPTSCYVVRCECGHFTKPQRNAYLAAHLWDLKNKRIRDKSPLSICEFIFWAQAWFVIVFSEFLFQPGSFLLLFCTGKYYYYSLFALLILFILRCWLGAKTNIMKLNNKISQPILKMVNS